MKYIKISKLIFGLRNKGGRSNLGQITCPRRGALTKRMYRFLDIKRRIWAKEGAIILHKYVYDPNRSAYITLIMLPNGIMTYILGAQYPEDQQRIYNLILSDYTEKGTSQSLKEIKNGSIIFNLEASTNNGFQYLKAAGVSGIILKKLSENNSRVVIKLKSGAMHAISSNATACLGITSNQNNFLINYKKAGRTRLKGRRPYTRPSAMNPVDHPMGGRTKGGIHPQNRNRILTGTPTARKKKNQNLELISSRTRKLKKRKI